MTPTTRSIPLFKLLWLPISRRSRELAERGIRVTWYMRPRNALVAIRSGPVYFG
jgi:hypothetical protein